ncbi:MAG: SusC/RagA family TonB-linked outer membrane protein [Chitinophagaceae bacterium]|nr:SusC/RagA family TonB-linked outer membrane protein [Chitinophagaceae bacterium]
MKKTLLLFTALLFLLVQTTFAQTQSIRGKILDETGQPVVGATVRVEGTNKGAVSDLNGNFKVDAESGSTLSISAIGMKKMTKSAEDGVVIKLASDVNKIKETVVTAFGIKKEKRTLSYATTTVKEDVITQGQNGNAMTALTGKVAGLQITNSSGTPGANAFIQLRGINSFELNTQPLLVVDGVPIDMSASTIGDPDESTNNVLSNISGGFRGLDINPDDIENVSVLKGPAATALYGSGGSNGVIMITTKKGTNKGGVGVSVNSSVTWDKVNKLPELQDQYLQGSGGLLNIPKNANNPSHSRTSWGPLGDTMYRDGQYYKWDKNGYLVGKSDPTAKTKFTPYDNVGDFFTTGVTWNNTVSLNTATDKSSLRVSFGNLNQKGVVHNSELKRNTININASTQASKNLTVSTGINYTNTQGTYVQQGSNLAGIMLGLLRNPINFDNTNGYSDAWKNDSAFLFSDGSMRSYRGYGVYDNPYYTINENLYTDKTNRMLGNLTMDYTVNKWLTLTNRLGGDFYTTNSQQNFGTQTIQIPATGRVSTRAENFQRFNNDIIATIKPYINKEWDLDILLGQNIMSERFLSNYVRGDNLLVDRLYNLNNAQNITQRAESDYVYRRMSEYGEVKVGYKTFLYLGTSARLEHATSFWPNYKGNLYGSVFGSFIFSDAFQIENKQFTYGKIRASYATAGQNPPVQSTSTRYITSSVADGWTDGNPSPINGQVIKESSRLYNPDLNPEKTGTFELGTELRFFKNRIGVDYTYYNSLTKDIFVNVPLARSSGYAEFFTNAGEIQNKGHELQMTFMPIKKRDFTWNIITNYSRNRTTVKKLADGVEQIILNGFEGSQVVVRDGQYGIFYGQAYERDANGNLLISDEPGNEGNPIVSSVQKNLGSVLPDWLGSINNVFNYKGIGLSVLIDTRQGGVIWNGTRGALATFGMAKETETRDTETKVFEGLMGHIGADGKIYHYDENNNEVPGYGKSNTTAIPLDETYYSNVGGGFSVNEPFVEDASWTRLREVGLSYTFTPKILENVKYVKSITAGFVGRNLILWTKYKGVDPETSLIGGGKAQGLDYFNNPGTKTYGINLKVNF